MSTSVNNLERKNLAWKISKLICIQEDRISIASFEGTIDTIPTDSYINNLNGVIELSGGYYSFELFALLSNGTIWTNAVSTYDEVRNWNQIKHISVEEQNGSYIAAVDIDGRILLAGWHYPFEDKEKQEIEQWSNLIEICAGYHYVTALTADGRVLCSDAKIQRIVEEWRNIRHIAIDYGNIYAWDDNGKICTTSSDYLQLRSIDDVILLEEKYILLGNGILRDRNFDSNEATILGNVVGCKNIDDIVVIVNGDGSVEINGALKEQYKVQPAINVFYNDKKSEHKSRIDSTRIALTDEEYRFRKRMEEEERKELEELEKQWRQERIIEQEELRRFTERENKEIIRKISTALVVVVGLILNDSKRS